MSDNTIEIPDVKPFENDVFKRELIAKNFMKIIYNNNRRLVISIDSDWGTGKTTFIKMWKALVDNDGEYKNHYETLYFNAWSNDYMEDPIVAILSEIDIDNRANGEKILCNMIKIGKKVAKPVASTLLKAMTSGILDLKDVNLNKDIEENLPELSSKIGEALINDAIESKKARIIFKEEMERFQRISNKKVIFFIDELDRCRPKFAIELLETIKHLFDMKNFVFIIALDKEQLSHSVATIYGQNMDTVGYLRRFFDLDYKVPKPDKKVYIGMKNKTIFNYYVNANYIMMFLEGFMIEFNFSLRDIDKAYFYIEMLLPLIEIYRVDNTYQLDYIVASSYLYSYMICIKIKRDDLYKKIINVEYNGYNDVKLEEIFSLDSIRGVKFNKEYIENWIFEESVLKNLIFYYLRLNYLAEKGNLISQLNEDDYKFNFNGISTSEGYSLIHLFDDDNKSEINKNLEFINSFK